MSTTNILNSTVTGVPFLEIGRISVVDKKIKINYQKKKNKQFFLFVCHAMLYGVMQRSKSKAIRYKETLNNLPVSVESSDRSQDRTHQINF